MISQEIRFVKNFFQVSSNFFRCSIGYCPPGGRRSSDSLHMIALASHFVKHFFHDFSTFLFTLYFVLYLPDFSAIIDLICAIYSLILPTPIIKQGEFSLPLQM
jgi:hypothetical protein